MQSIVEGHIVTADRCADAELRSGPAGCDGPGNAGPASAGLAVVPRVDVVVRAGTLADVPGIDRAQKADGRALGFLPTMALHGKVKLNQVLVAEVDGQTAGHLIAADRYQKRDEVGYVTQIAVGPAYRRHLVAATLLQTQFDRSAYGCRLYSCWCAQDLKANEFWEAMGFTPIAFRRGGRTKGKTASDRAGPRLHVFWQKRVRADDTTTPWWYPAQTGGGEMREDRLVFPIPPGVSWRDVLPTVLPETANAAIADRTGAAVCGPLPAVPEGQDPALSTRPCHPADATAASPGAAAPRSTRRDRAAAATRAAALADELADPEARAAARERIRVRVRENPPKPVRPAHVPRGGFWAAPDWDDYEPAEAEIDAEVAIAFAARRKTAKKTAVATQRKIDPRLIAMARELRDRWTEEVAAGNLLPAAAGGKYALTRDPATIERSRANALPGRTTMALPTAATAALPPADGTAMAA